MHFSEANIRVVSSIDRVIMEKEMSKETDKDGDEHEDQTGTERSHSIY